jgi:K+-transporting ATPase KdpF subunit
MKTKFPVAFLSLVMIPVKNGEAASNNAFSYVIGGVIALLILGYLIYTLMHPEKF